MKVIFIPDYRDKNSYQANLSCPLSRQDIYVHFGGRVIKSVIEYWKPDILHIHWHHPFLMSNSRLGTIAKSTKFICELSLLKLLGIKIIWTVHNIVDHEGKFKSEELFFDKLLIRLCDKLITHCSSAKAEIKKIYEDASITIVPHGNYVGQYKNTMTFSQARERLNIDECDKVFLYFGQVRPYKGIPELISMFNELDCKQAKLLIVGKPLNSDIATDVLNRCKDGRIKATLEFIPDDDIQVYMNAADVVVLPFKDILMSGSAILAMSFGKPIIAPGIGCITDILDNEGSYLYSKTDNSESALFETMQHVIYADRATLVNMGKHNLELAEQLKWDEIAKETHDIYEKCLDAK